MASSRILLRVALVRTDVSEELSPSFIRVARIETNASEIGFCLRLQGELTQVGLIDITAPSLWTPTTTPIVKNGVFWDVTLCGSRKNRRFGGT
jgi:hypothetical protein